MLLVNLYPVKMNVCDSTVIFMESMLTFTMFLGSDDGSIRLWNTETGQQLQVYDGLGKVSRARFCYHDSSILIEMNKKLTVRATKTGTWITDIVPSMDRLLGLSCLSDFCTSVYQVYFQTNCKKL